MKRWLPLFPALALFVLFSACEDPSAVGIGLIDDQVNPTVEAVPLSSFEPVSVADRTGNTFRVLAGMVEDPVLGTIEATGYVNFALADNAPELSAPVDSVHLSLAYDYVYGDTTATLRLTLRDIVTDERWSDSGATADTSLPAGDAIMDIEISPEDTTKRVALPASWIEAHEEALVTENFNDVFKGFVLEPSGTSSIRGFDVQDISLAIQADDVTAVAGVSNLISGIERTTPPDVPGGDLVLFQDGVPPDLDGAVRSGSRMRVAVNLEPFTNRALNGARLELNVNRAALWQDTPAHFYRPEPTELRLVGVDEDGEVVSSGGVPLVSIVPSLSEDEQRLTFQAPDNQSFSLREYLQDRLLGKTRFDDIAHLEVRVPTNVNTLDALLIRSTDSEAAPVLRLTLSGD